MKIKKETKYMSGGGGMVYCVGLIGAIVYYIQTADSVIEIIFGVVKAIVWPGILVHKLMMTMGM